MDRYAALPIVRAALGLPQVSYPCPSLAERLSSFAKPSIRRSVILEAEMVAYSERTHGIDGKSFDTFQSPSWILISNECVLQSSGGYVVSSNLPRGVSDGALQRYHIDP